MASLAPLLRERRILVCVGSGGVGKTTTAATLGLGGAQLGRRTLVLTIDPARRLANALGLEGLSHDVREVPRDRLAAAGLQLPAGGALFAMMLDQKRAFDELVERHAKDATTRDRIFSNPIYRQMSSSLAGSHEYAAMSKLYEIHAEGGYDLIVLDTPPTANALDFLDAPERISGAIDSPAIEWLTKPYLEAGHFSMKALGMGAAFVLGRLAKFVGSDFLDEMARFFVEFNQILGGFRERAQKVYEVLRGKEAAFVLVSSAEPLSVDEALYFNDRLRSASMPLGGFVVNRVHPRRPPLTVDGKPLDRAALVTRLEGRAELQGFAPDDLVQLAADLERTHKELDALAVLDEQQIARLRARAGATPIVTVPLFQHDVYDLPALAEVLRHLAA